jgi:hypothetical protein
MKPLLIKIPTKKFHRLPAFSSLCVLNELQEKNRMYTFQLIMYLLLTLKTPSQDPVRWTFKAVQSGKGYSLQLAARIYPGWHLFSQVQPEKALVMPTCIRFSHNPLVTHIGKIAEVGRFQKTKDWILGTEANEYTDLIIFSQQVIINGKAGTGVWGSITYQACTSDHCLLPQTIPFTIPLP